MKSIVGRLTDLGLRELFRLLASADAEGVVELDTPAGKARLWVRGGEVAGNPERRVVRAALGRAGTFCFRPGSTAGLVDWVSQDAFLAGVDESAQGSLRWQPSGGPMAPAAADPLSELRDSLAEVQLPAAAARIVVVTADSRPYRAVGNDWRQRGWELDLTDQPGWPEAPAPDVLIVHVPTSTTLAGRAEPWLALAQRAADQHPPVPVLWVGGVADAHLRHQTVMAGVDFLLPAPAGELGEAARWFREEVTYLVERLLGRRPSEVPGEGEAFRDFFVALHADSSPAETHASLLRFASSFYARGMLFGVRDAALESLGGYGFAMGSGVRISRGISAFEEAIIGRQPVELDVLAAEEMAVILPALGVTAMEKAAVYPVLAAGDCVALFMGEGRLVPDGTTGGLAGLLARSGAELLGV
ncbi:MAG TPA: DUF4388 domain-containing protein [Thermoanaerobaculaceae bacterium]|nr:DUF4388 domain-containing protein [Thermoanaerobaculaceae bacterium]